MKIERTIPNAFGVATILSQGTNHGAILIFQLVSSIFVARNLGPSALGELAIIQTIIILLKPILDAGTRGYLIRELILSPNKSTQLQWARAGESISTKVSLYVLLIIVFVLLILPCIPQAPYLQLPINELLWGYCLGFVIFANLFEKKGHSQILLLTNIKSYLKRNLIINVASSMLKLLGALTIESKPLLIGFFFTTIGLEYFAKGLWNKIDLKKDNKPNNKPNNKPKNETALLKPKKIKLFKEAIKYLPSELSLASEGQVPRIWLANLGDPIGSTLGNFSVAQKNGIVMKTLNKISHDNDITNPSLKTGLKYATLGAVISALTAPLIPLLYGKDFSDATYYAYILIVPGFLTLIGSKISNKLIRQSMTGAASKINILGVLMSLALCWLLIPPYQVAGASIALSIGWLTQISLGLWLLNPNKNKGPYKTL